MDALRVHEEVADALLDGRPVVALESTIITHGLPYPTNVEVASAVEATVRDEGAVPATIAVIKGQIHVGLDPAELQALADTPGVAKAGSRDLPMAIGQGVSASTTVGATCTIAQAAGIAAFATGGIGGVHHGAAHSFDESADLTDLSRTGRIVVSAGVKSLLDQPATLERLETLGVPVIGFRTHRLPGFLVRDTDLLLSTRCDDVAEIVRAARARAGLGLERASLLVLQPVAAEDALDADVHDRAVSRALSLAQDAGLRGAAVTPFVLAQIHDLTAGGSLRANASLVRANARLASQIALALSRA